MTRYELDRKLVNFLTQPAFVWCMLCAAQDDNLVTMKLRTQQLTTKLSQFVVIYAPNIYIYIRFGLSYHLSAKMGQGINVTLVKGYINIRSCTWLRDYQKSYVSILFNSPHQSLLVGRHASMYLSTDSESGSSLEYLKYFKIREFEEDNKFWSRTNNQKIED